MRSNDDQDMTTKRHRALYRAAYRGTREMDFLLGRFAKAKVQDMNSAELSAFEELMMIPDPVLAGALIDETQIEVDGAWADEITSLIQRIRQFHKTKRDGSTGE